MSIPEWAASMVQNYRRMFKEKHGRETTVTDEQIWHVCNTIYNDESNKDQDVERVEVILELERV